MFSGEDLYVDALKPFFNKFLAYKRNGVESRVSRTFPGTV
jgi:hypothetical protein